MSRLEIRSSSHQKGSKNGSKGVLFHVEKDIWDTKGRPFARPF